jgi:hypothetical protein
MSRKYSLQKLELGTTPPWRHATLAWSEIIDGLRELPAFQYYVYMYTHIGSILFFGEEATTHMLCQDGCGEVPLVSQHGAHVGNAHLPAIRNTDHQNIYIGSV